MTVLTRRQRAVLESRDRLARRAVPLRKNLLDFRILSPQIIVIRRISLNAHRSSGLEVLTVGNG